MSPRSIRRAAERRAQKEARKAFRLAATPMNEEEQPIDNKQKLDSTLDWDCDAQPRQDRRQSANHRNAQLSTGPCTPEGKRISSMHAVKTGLTGRTVLLPTDDADAYRQHLAAYEQEHQPATPRESELVQSLADTQWRLARIPGLEFAIYARGRHESAEMYANYPQAERIALTELETHLRYEKQLRNLQLQESRLYRRYTLDLAELRRLQAERKAQAEAAAKSATKIDSALIAPRPTGFVFSSAPSDASPSSVAPPIDRENAA